MGVYKRSLKRKPEYVKAWEDRAQAKIVLKVDSEELMDQIEAAAREAGLITYVVVSEHLHTVLKLVILTALCVLLSVLLLQTDAGRTQIAAGSRTVLGIGPAPGAEIDRITGKDGRFPLKLMF